MKSIDTRWIMYGFTALALMALGMSATRAHAETDVDLRASVYPEADAFAIGGGLLTNVGHGHWFFNPNLEVAMGDRRDLMVLSGDFHYDFATAGNLSIWAGGGPALLHSNPEVGDSDTDLGLNALMGLGGRFGAVRPFGQVRGTLTNDSQLSIAGGIRF